MMDKILVLLATYNGEKYLPQQLDSLFSQEGVQVSVLVRDDGSTDKTTEILTQYHKSNNLKWYQGKHLNVQRGFLDLMKEGAKTDFQYFAFCDQDDVWDKDKLSVAVSKLKSGNKNIPLLYYCGQRLVDEKLTFIENHKMNQQRTDYARFILNDAAGCTEVFNRKLIEAIVSYDPQYILMHDTWVLKVCLAIGGHIFVDEMPHMSYRQHGQNVMGLRRDIKSKLIRAKQYISEQRVEPQMWELAIGYEENLSREYRQIIEDVLSYKINLKSRRRLMNKKLFNFGDIGVQITYYLKIMLNML